MLGSQLVRYLGRTERCGRAGGDVSLEGGLMDRKPGRGITFEM